MFLSLLGVNIGNDPDRPRPGRLWLRNLYHVHQRLCMAFPSPERKSGDTHFLQPFKAEDFGQNQVHVARGTDSGFLFRVDPQSGGSIVILVQSAIKPDWEYAFHNAEYLLAAPPQVKVFDPRFSKGQYLRFRLMANPTRKIGTKSSQDGKKQNGKRVPVRTDQFIDWLVRRAELAGFSIDRELISIQPAYVYINKQPNGHGHRLRSVRYDGTLKVIDPASFRRILCQGIGPGKAFGFGLLSIAPKDQ